MVEDDPYAGLANQCLKPLGQLSEIKHLWVV